METKQLFMRFSILLLFFVGSNTIVAAQSPVSAPAGAPPPTVSAASPVTVDPQAPPLVSGLVGPLNVTAILEKVGHFHTFIGLLKGTGADTRINEQLNYSSGGLTMFAPSDAAFSNMERVTLNTLSSQQQTEMVHFHILPTFYSLSLFQRASNPLSTEAGDTRYGQFPMNVSATTNSVSIKTGITNSSVSSTVYTDGQLAIYEVDHVLLPQKFFITPPLVPAPAPAPAPTPTQSKPSKAAPKLQGTARPVDSSDAISLRKMFQGSCAVALLAAYSLRL